VFILVLCCVLAQVEFKEEKNPSLVSSRNSSWEYARDVTAIRHLEKPLQGNSGAVTVCVHVGLNLTLGSNRTLAFSRAALLWLLNITLPSVDEGSRGLQRVTVKIHINAALSWQAELATEILSAAAEASSATVAGSVLCAATRRSTPLGSGPNGHPADSNCAYIARTRLDADDVLHPRFFDYVGRAVLLVAAKNRLGALVAVQNCRTHRLVAVPGHCELLGPPRGQRIETAGCSCGQTVVLRRDVLTRLKSFPTGDHTKLLDNLRGRVAREFLGRKKWEASLPMGIIPRGRVWWMSADHKALDAADEATSSVMLFEPEGPQTGAMSGTNSSAGRRDLLRLTPPALYMYQPLSGSFWANAMKEHKTGRRAHPNGCSAEQRLRLQYRIPEIPVWDIFRVIDALASDFNITMRDACASISKIASLPRCARDHMSVAEAASLQI